MSRHIHPRRDSVGRLWKLLDEWADEYARANQVDKHEIMERIVERHPQLSRNPRHEHADRF